MPPTTLNSEEPFIGTLPGSHTLVREHCTMGNGGGFALHEAFSGRVVGVSDPRVVQFPPFGDGVAATVQTHWVTTAKNRPFCLNRSALWRIRCQSRCAARTRTAKFARQPLDTHVNL